MIDKVLSLESDTRLTAIKNIALAEDVYTDHFFGNPIMPGALQIESLAQACTILLEVSHRLKYKALLVMVEKAKFRKSVRPGDQMLIEVNINSGENNLFYLDGRISVGGIKVTDAKLVFSLQPVDDYYSPNLKFMTRAMYANFLRGAELKGIDQTWGDEYWRQKE